MEELPAIGKISSEVFSELAFSHLGANDKSSLVNPRHGAGVSIVEIAGQAVSFVTDQIFIMPEYGWERAAWFAVHTLLSSSVACGLPPKYLSINLGFPAGVTEAELATMWETMHQECEKTGVSIISRHLGRYENCRYPMVGGATMVGIGEPDSYVSPKFIRPGDKIIITKGPAVEATGILGTMFPVHNEQSLGKGTARKVSDIFYKMSVMTEAMTAVSAGVRDDGISAMHNAGEYGIWGGLYEMAKAAGVGVRIDQDRIVIEPGVAEICRLYGIDPYTSAGKGALIIACRPHKADEVARLIQKQGIRASMAGEFTEKEQGMILTKGGNPRPLVRPVADSFWKAFHGALKRNVK